MSLFEPIGLAAVMVGFVLLVMGIRGHRARQPKYVAMLIGGMMLLAFGFVLAGFAIAYENTAPLDLNSGAAR
jgi:Kef-type K+ transport system membrane component KefB